MMLNEFFAEKDAWLKEQIDALTAERDALRKEFFTQNKDYLTVGEKMVAGEYVIAVQRNARFDPAQARRVLSESDFEMILSTKPDSALAKKMLAPAVYELTQREFDPKIVVTPVKDEV